jgi:hypothetical protein
MKSNTTVIHQKIGDLTKEDDKRGSESFAQLITTEPTLMYAKSRKG